MNVMVKKKRKNIINWIFVKTKYYQSKHNKTLYHNYGMLVYHLKHNLLQILTDKILLGKLTGRSPGISSS